MSTKISQIIAELERTRDELDERTRNIYNHLPTAIRIMRHPDQVMAGDNYLQWEYGKWRELYILLSGATRSQYVFATLLKVAATNYLEPYDSNVEMHAELRKRIKKLLRNAEDKCLEAKIHGKELAKLKKSMYDGDEDTNPIMQDIMDGKIAINSILEATWMTLQSKACTLKSLLKEPPAPRQATPEPTIPDSEDEQNDPGIDSSTGMTTAAGMPLDMNEQRRMSGFLVRPQKRPRYESSSGHSPPNKRIRFKVNKRVRFNELVVMKEIPVRGEEEEHVDAEMRSMDAEEEVPLPEPAGKAESIPELEY